MNDINSQISTTLKSLRQARGWSLDKAAQETGVSKAMLGQIERGESSPTIATLWKIASGFQTSFSSFIEPSRAYSKTPIYRSGKTRELHPQDEKIRVMPLFPFDKHLHFEVYIIELLPQCEHISPPHEPGTIEHVIVVSGKIEVLVDNTWHTLNKGEGLRFEANLKHGYANRSAKTACIHDIIHYPNQSKS
ncbi:MAG: helix-turn-helix domain-containing protein [Candidatus Berkiella sp.]